MVRRKKDKDYEAGIVSGLGRMKRWYKCQEVAKCLYDSTASDIEVDLLLQQAETGMFNNQDKKL